jgi:hypothetical protein
MFISRRRLNHLLEYAFRLGVLYATEQEKASKPPGLTMNAYQVESQRRNAGMQ